MTELVQKDLGGIISHTAVDVPHDGARWDASPAPTVTLYHRAGGEIAAAATATEVAALALSGAAAAAGRSVPVTSTTGVERHGQLLLGPNASGQWEWVTVEAFTTSLIITLDELQYSYSTDAALKSHRLTRTLSTAEASSVEVGCFAAWAYSIAGVARIEHTTFAISRYVPRLSLTASQAISVYPRLRDIMGSDQRVEILLRRLWDHHVMVDVAKILGSSGAVVAGETLETALLNKLGEQLAREAKELESAAAYSALYITALDEIRTTITDIDESGGQNDEEQPRSRHAARMWRG